jgi:hypothetical protein
VNEVPFEEDERERQTEPLEVVEVPSFAEWVQEKEKENEKDPERKNRMVFRCDTYTPRGHPLDILDHFYPNVESNSSPYYGKLRLSKFLSNRRSQREKSREREKERAVDGKQPVPSSCLMRKRKRHLSNCYDPLTDLSSPPWVSLYVPKVSSTKLYAMEILSSFPSQIGVGKGVTQSGAKLTSSLFDFSNHPPRQISSIYSTTSQKFDGVTPFSHLLSQTFSLKWIFSHSYCCTHHSESDILPVKKNVRSSGSQMSRKERSMVMQMLQQYVLHHSFDDSDERGGEGEAEGEEGSLLIFFVF